MIAHNNIPKNSILIYSHFVVMKDEIEALNKIIRNVLGIIMVVTEGYHSIPFPYSIDSDGNMRGCNKCSVYGVIVDSTAKDYAFFMNTIAKFTDYGEFVFFADGLFYTFKIMDGDCNQPTHAESWEDLRNMN